MAKVLVVDDSSLSRRISRRILEEAGHDIVEAEDGISAIERYFLEKPDIVLLDITMKGMNGIAVLTKLRELDPVVKVIIATADIQSSTREMTTAAGAIGFIAKPLSKTEVERAVALALEGTP